MKSNLLKYVLKKLPLTIFLKKLLIIFFLLITKLYYAQDTATVRKNSPNVFLDCEFCDLQYYRQQLPYVNFVRDRHLTDVYIMITRIETGGGSQNYDLFFTGENKFRNIKDTLSTSSPANLAEAGIRDLLLEKIRFGLLPFILKTPLAALITFSVNAEEQQLSADKIKDKWNFWTFSPTLDLNGNSNAYSINLNINSFYYANRTTEKFKIEFGGWYNNNIQEFQINDSVRKRGQVVNFGNYHYMAKSIGEHIGIGHYAVFAQNSAQNLWHSISYFPAIEYNVFKYKDAARRQMRFTYRVGGRHQKYRDSTINNKTSDFFGLHSLVIEYRQIEKWGNVNISAGGWHYFNYSKNYSASIYPSINFNPITGLRIGLWAGYQIQNDQFFLRKKEPTSDEILLGQIQLETGFNFNYGCSIGYIFGSKFSNVVNVRFDLSDRYW